jgi:hypothetical protein
MDRFKYGFHFKIIFSWAILTLLSPSKSFEMAKLPNLDRNLTHLRILRIQMGNEDGDGMDGGFIKNQNWGGGRFSFKLCFLEMENQCCDTKNLNTKDNNWEQGEVNYFVGYQLGECENFQLNNEGK